MRRALLTPLYRCGKSTFKRGACGLRQEERGLRSAPKRLPQADGQRSNDDQDQAKGIEAKKKKITGEDMDSDADDDKEMGEYRKVREKQQRGKTRRNANDSDDSLSFTDDEDGVRPSNPSAPDH